MKRISTSITRSYLESIAPPNHGGRYTPISHKSIIDKVYEELVKRGFNVETEQYRANHGGNVANGIHILDQGYDPDMKMAFAWANSYDKSMRFKCSIGVYIPETENYIFAGDISSYARKHTGKADEEVIDMIQVQLNMANAHYTELVNARDMLLKSDARLRTYAELTGRLFIEKQCISTEQASEVRRHLIDMDSSYQYNAWDYYNNVATALRMSHPRNWLEDQAECHEIITKYFSLATLTSMDIKEDVQAPVQDIVQEPDNQLTIFDVMPDTLIEEPTSVVVEEFPEELFTPTSINDLPIDIQEQIYADDILEQKTLSGEVNPDEEFFNFGDAELPTFDLPDL